MPKFNMYQSLHTTVIGPQGKPVEMQIRTFAMHRRAEYGVAAHWKYKEDGRAGVDTEQLGDLDDMTWVRQLLDWQSEVEDPGEFLESLRFEINRAEVYVFTPRGDVIALPDRAPRRSTSPTPCTPRSATTPSAPGSTAGWCRWSRRSRTATWSRSSPPRRRTPARRATGSPS